MTFAPGTPITPVVRLVRPLGRGGMGAVWVADHLALQTQVVVKLMADGLSTDPVSLARFSREASSAAAVKSPHVVQMLDHGFTPDGTPFIVMELLDGEDLRHRLKRERVVALPELGAILSQACKALARAHASGIVHRDIKPDNVFLCHTDDGEPFVKLLDFGIAKSAGAKDFHMTDTGVMVGTPYYMSPEQAVGSPAVDFATDLWSLGVVAFEAMTGTRPFDGPVLGALTLAICNEAPPVPSRVDPTIPKSIDTWLARACARDRAARFSGAKAMSDAFAAALRGSVWPQAIPLAFEATALIESPCDPDGPGPMTASGASTPSRTDDAPPEGAPAFSTTTAAISLAPVGQASSSTEASSSASAAAVSAGRAPSASGAGAAGRASSIAVTAGGALLLGLGLAAGFAVARAPVPRPPPALEARVGVGELEGAVAAAASRPSTPPSSSIVEQPSAPGSSSAPRAATTPASAALANAVLPVDRPPATPRPQTRLPPRTAPRAPSTTAVGAAVADSPPCNPPYFFDAAHNKVYKTECL